MSQLAVQRQRVVLQTVLTRFVDAERHLSESLSLSGAFAAPFERALALLDMAELDEARGDTAAALMILSEARAICELLPARTTLERVAQLEERLKPCDSS